MEQEGSKNSSCSHNLDVVDEHVLLKAQPKQRLTNVLHFHKQLSAFILHVCVLSGSVMQNHFRINKQPPFPLKFEYC